MAKYTVELYKLADKGILFNFDYEFYDEMAKPLFEKMFIDYYYFDEIGSETIGRFKQRLKSKLSKKMPYYKQLYNIEEVSKTKDFMNQKDLIDTFTRELQTTNIGSMDRTSNVNSITDSNMESNGSSTNDSLLSNIDDGVSKVRLQEGYLTGVSNDKNVASNSSVSKDENLSNSSEIMNNNNDMKTIEKTTFQSKGDIGIQTPAYAVTEWRKILINLNEMIIDDCYDLFMQVY